MRAQKGAGLVALATAGLVTVASSSQLSGRKYFTLAGMSACPIACEKAGPDRANWTRYYELNRVLTCASEAKLLDFSLYTSFEDPNNPTIVRSCSTARGDRVFAERSQVLQDVEADSGFTQISVTPELFLLQTASAEGQVAADQAAKAIQEAQAALLFDSTGDGRATTFAVHYGEVVVGVYVGASVDKRTTAALALDSFLEHIESPDFGRVSTVGVQVSGSGRPADQSVGVIVDSTPGKALARVQRALKAWSEAERVGKDLAQPATTAFKTSSIWVKSPAPGNVASSSVRRGQLAPRDECRTIQVEYGDSCGTLASKCGISGADFEKYNPDSDLCSTLRPGQYVCCSAGDLPDVRPKPQPDGTCAVYTVQMADDCSKISASNGLTVDELKDFNKNTWGWNGCDPLYVGTNICLSEGDPPMPAAVEGTVCGPQVRGTERPTNGTDLADLNPCPLNVCCNVWGQCGTTADFCTIAPGEGPGTTQPGKHSCISNCGTEIVNVVTPKERRIIAYFEAWNPERPCLNMDVRRLEGHATYTHVHFAFGDVNENFEATIAPGPAQSQFLRFTRGSSYKRIIAFGGWAASTSPTTYWIFREGVKPENRETLARNLAAFVYEHDLDGLDLDWEYPGAPDIPGIPEAEPIDGPNYLELLKLLRELLPDKSLSIAAPASYWYLKAFPIAEIAKVVDYIVYMTYDLHGQWDYDNPWASPGCPAGNCLRSHINVTETENALVMITKAGVTTDKIIVGVTSYGRSFGMTDPDCTGPMCTFVGPESGAEAGRCTGTAGYISNAEINEIIRKDPDARTWVDAETDSQILVSGNTWVAYMDGTRKLLRMMRWLSMDFGGTSDWAIDLAAFEPDDLGINPAAGIRLGTHVAAWWNVSCNDIALARDEEADEVERWKGLGCETAWDSAISDWKKNGRPNNREFSQYISSKLSGPPDMDCSTTALTGCSTGTVECNDDLGRSPAAALILRSFTKLARLYVNFYIGIGNAQTAVGTTLEKFVEIFAPEEEPDPAMGWILDFLGTGLGMVAGPSFKAVFSGFYAAHEHLSGALEETVMAAVGFGVDAAKQYIEADKTKPVTGDLAQALGSFVLNWKEIITETQKALFNGSDSSIKHLETMISDGKLLYINEEDFLHIEKRVQRALYAYLIPYAWSLRGARPVLVKTDVGCDDDVPHGEPSIFPGDSKKAAVCNEHTGYKTMLLLSPDGPSHVCRPNQQWADNCDIQKLSLLPGFDTLDESEPSYGNITRLDIVKAIMLRYEKYGNRGLGDIANLEDSRVQADLWDQLDGGDIALMPGVINIPMCDIDEVFQNWKRKTVGQDVSYPSFPCNRVEDDD